MLSAKSLVAELAPPHAQSAWGSRGERVRATGLAACCNYFSKKKKKFNCWVACSLRFFNTCQILCRLNVTYYLIHKLTFKHNFCTLHQPRHGRMSMWLDLDPIRGVAVIIGKGNVGHKILSLARAKGVIALGRK